MPVLTQALLQRTELGQRGTALHPAATHASQGHSEVSATATAPADSLSAALAQISLQAATSAMVNGDNASEAPVCGDGCTAEALVGSSSNAAEVPEAGHANAAEAPEAGHDSNAKASEPVRPRRTVRRRQTRPPAKDSALTSPAAASGWFSSTHNTGGSSHGPAFNPPPSNSASATAEQPRKISFQLGRTGSQTKKAGKAQAPVPAFTCGEDSAQAAAAQAFTFCGSMPSDEIPAHHLASAEAMDAEGQLDEGVLEAAQGLANLGWQAGHAPSQYFTAAPAANDFAQHGAFDAAMDAGNLAQQAAFDAAMEETWFADMPMADQAGGLASGSAAAHSGADLPSSMDPGVAEGADDLPLLDLDGLDSMCFGDGNAISNAMDTGLGLLASTAFAQANSADEPNTTAADAHRVDFPINGQAAPDAWCSRSTSTRQADANASTSAAPHQEASDQVTDPWDSENEAWFDDIVDNVGHDIIF